MGNIYNKERSVDIPEGSPLLEDIKRIESLEQVGIIERSDALLNMNNGEPIYGSICCKERERLSNEKTHKNIQLVLEQQRKKRNCCKCIYGRCRCKNRERSDSNVSV